MRVFRILSVLLISFAMVIMLANSSLATTHVRITVEPPSSATTTGSTFTTELNMSSWNGAVGALDLTVRYDPSVLHIADFSMQPDSPFYSSLQVDSDSYTSGETQIAGFQIRDSEAWETPITLGLLTWEVVGVPGSTTDITIDVNSIVGVDWNPVELQVYGQQISVPSDEGQFNIWIVIGAIIGVFIIGGVVYYSFGMRKRISEAT